MLSEIALCLLIVPGLPALAVALAMFVLSE